MRSRVHTPLPLLIAVLAAGLMACQDQGETEEEAPVQEPTPTAVHMQEHFSQAVALRDAVIAGDLAAAQKPATWMAEHQMEGGLPEGWEPYVVEMQNAAAEAQGASELDAVASAAGAMAAQCGACHQAQDAMIEVSVGEAPVAEPGTAAHMARHLWAMERLWDGLVTPSDPAWTAGSEVLADEPLASSSFGDDPQMQEELSDLASRIHALGAEAATATDLATRGQLYGEMLSTCAPCHTRLQDMP